MTEEQGGYYRSPVRVTTAFCGRHEAMTALSCKNYNRMNVIGKPA